MFLKINTNFAGIKTLNKSKIKIFQKYHYATNDATHFFPTRKKDLHRIFPSRGHMLEKIKKREKEKKERKKRLKISKIKERL